MRGIGGDGAVSTKGALEGDSRPAHAGAELQDASISVIALTFFRSMSSATNSTLGSPGQLGFDDADP